MGLENRYDSKSFAKLWVDTFRKIAVIVGEDTQLDTQDSTKLEEKPEVVAQRYRIRILGEDPIDKPESKLPVAYPLQLSSGLGAQDMGTVRYTANTYVYISKDPNSGTYLIERVVPNYISEPLKDFQKSSDGDKAYSGFLPGGIVPQTHYKVGDLNFAELFGAQDFSEEDYRWTWNTKLPSFTSPCKPVNTEGVNDAIENLIKEIEDLKTGITGKDSFLYTSQQFTKDAQSAIKGASFNVGIGNTSYEITLANAAGDISKIIASLVQEVRKWVLRKVSTAINNVIGNVPLSARYLANEGTDKALSAISCLFYRILKGLEDLVLNILRQIIDKLVNAPTCLIENILSGIIGNILGNLIGGLNSILSSIGTAIGSVISFANELLEFVIDILDFFKCPVKNECPQAEEWDFINGSTAPKTKLDFNKIFQSAKGVVEDVSNSIGSVEASFDELLDDWTFKNKDGSPFDPLSDINVGNIFQSILGGGCDVGPQSCGPPKVVFFGGDGSGGTGNAVVNAAGEILGVQIITPGNYKTPPLIEFQDNCGNGKGAYGTVVLDPFTPYDPFRPIGDDGTGSDDGDGFDDGGVVGPIGGGLPGAGGGEDDDDDDGGGGTGTDRTYDITDNNGDLVVASYLSDYVTVKRYNEIVSRSETRTRTNTYSTVPLYRYYNTTNFDHFTGLDITPPSGYINEGVIAHVFVGSQPPGTVPLVDSEPGKPASTYTAYVFPRSEAQPFSIDGREIPTKLLYAKTNNVNDVLFTSDINEGSPQYVLDRTNDIRGFAFFAPLSPVNITVSSENEVVVYDGTGTEGHLVGSIGYEIDIKGVGDDLSFKMGDFTKRIRASGLIASDSSILVSSAYPQTVDSTRFRVAFDMTNSQGPGRQATYVRGFNISVRVEGGGISDVIIEDPGYGYHPYPYGDKGGSGRVWADRCQTTILRANFNWDIPSSLGTVKTAYYGDIVFLPGKDPVFIDENFTEDMIPGCIVKGVNPKLKDMTNFDFTRGKVYETGIRHQFGAAVDLKHANDEGFSDQDVRFFLENKFFLRVGPKMRELLLDPNWGKIPEFSVTFTSPGCPPGTPDDPDLPPTVGVFPPGGFPGFDGFSGFGNFVGVLGGIVIKNPGFGYEPGDTLDIDGADVDLTITDGSITGVKINNPGIGFTNLPDLTINTRTGYNAILKPVLKFINVDNNAGFAVPFGTPTLQVIDCVGKV
tara:strand:- start:884 stop:4483 length:3600 start_codon:yes stop_codon:yes gene_type:complete